MKGYHPDWGNGPYIPGEVSLLLYNECREVHSEFTESYFGASMVITEFNLLQQAYPIRASSDGKVWMSPVCKLQAT